MVHRKTAFKWATYGFALFGLAMVGVLVGQQFHLLTVRGSVDPRSSLFSLTSSQLHQYALPRVQTADAASTDGTDGAQATNPDGTPVIAPKPPTPAETLCKIMVLSKKYPAAGTRIYAAFTNTNNIPLVDKMLTATTTSNTDLSKDFELCASYTHQAEAANYQPDAYSWLQSDEWSVLHAALSQDHDAILRAAHDADINPRILIGPVIGEQLRFFTSARSTFKSYFEPLKLFANLSKFSFGVAGLKPDTAKLIEDNAHNPKSPFYPGVKYEHVLDYPDGVDAETERLNRITDDKDHYWSYMYVAMDLKEYAAQWRNAGYVIDDRPDVLATLYNLGHNHSIPNANPAAGGAPITINGKTYTFGGLAYDFYWSGELQELFPY